MAVIVEVRVADDPSAWSAAGFTLDGEGRVVLGTTTVRLVPVATDGGRPGVTGWTLAGLPQPPPGGAIDGLPTEAGEPGPPAGPQAHPNGVTKVDHVVVTTPDLDRTTAALEALGIAARRTRDAGTGPDGIARRQRFFRLGEVVLELVGPTTPTGDGPARFWGLAHEVADLDATATLLGDALTAPRDAVQAGRRIASLRRTAGVAVPTAFLTPDVGLGARRADQ
ncbi:MAG TPA: VOC family protein [Acidimicrobiales bacterium]|nr:VOC family protein [Acidimicrobiales bacterium]